MGCYCGDTDTVLGEKDRMLIRAILSLLKETKRFWVSIKDLSDYISRLSEVCDHTKHVLPIGEIEIHKAVLRLCGAGFVEKSAGGFDYVRVTLVGNIFGPLPIPEKIAQYFSEFVNSKLRNPA